MIPGKVREGWTRLRFFLFRRDTGETDEELQFHIERQTELNVAAGMTPEEARRQALIVFGGVERARETCSEERPSWLIETLFRDVRYGLRGLRRNPVFAITAVATLAIGIGATTAVFSVVDRILFRRLPYAHADRLVSVGLAAPIEPDEFMLGGSYYEWRDHQTPFEAMTSETNVDRCDLTEQNPMRLHCANVEANFLPTLGIAPLVGRNFTSEEDRPNAPSVALISYALWKNHFGRNPGILNKTISIDGHETRVIGVLPKDFEMPRLQAADIVVPQALDEAAQRKADPGTPMWAFARLKPGVTIEQAKAMLQPVFNYSLALAPARFRNEVHLKVRTLRDRQMHDVQLMAWVLLSAVLAVLLIACANVASLFMARGAARERELAVRVALGAGRSRLIRQVLTEALLITFMGAAAGCALAELLLRIFVAIAPEGIPFLDDARLDLRIVLFTVSGAILCGILLGMVPAMQRPRAEALAGRVRSGITHARLRQWLVAGQIALSVVLLSSAMLLLRSFRSLQEQNLGMSPQSVVTASISLGQVRYPEPGQQMAFFQQVEARLRRVPGVEALALSDTLPPGGWRRDQIYTSIAIGGRPLPTGGTGGLVVWRSVTPEYFRALDVPIVQGTGFLPAEQNSNEHFIVLSQALAERMFPHENPVGQHLQPGLSGPWYTVAGVAANVKNSGLTGEDEPEYYRLRRNRAEDWERDSMVIVRTSLSSEAMATWMRSEIASVDPTVPVVIETLSQSVNKLADRPRFETALLGFFAVSGLLLAVVGLYGVIAFLVVQRTQEIGVRMAMGATRADILRLVLGKGMGLVLLGGLCGLVAAFGVSRLVKSLLFSVSTHDPVSFAAVVLVLCCVALIATLVPALAATRVNPNVALRCE